MTLTADTSPETVPPMASLGPLLGDVLPALLARQGGMLSVKSLDSGRYVHVSDALAAWFGRRPDELTGRLDADWLDAAPATALRAAEQTAVLHGEPLASDHQFELAGRRVDVTVWRAVTPPDADGRRYLVALWQDRGPERQREQQLRQALEQIEQQQQAHERLRRELADQALRDPASGLHRRAHFEDQLRREVDLSTREHREFAIVFIELDPFGPPVLALGAQGEHAVMEAMGRLLRSGTRAMDTACRHDDRRFAVLLSGVGLATAHARMEGLRRKCATQIVVQGGQELGFTVSMGVASFPHTAGTQEALTGACESALAEACRRGGNQVALAAIRFEPA